jgi:hypothetical protein
MWYITRLEEKAMNLYDKAGFVLFGVVFWIAGTLLYRGRGTVIFETTSLRYWINFVLTPMASTAVCVLLFRIRRVPAADWAAASLLIALPGMFGEALILSRFAVFMPRMHPETGGKYGALLFASYGLFLSIAEVVTLKASPPPIPR